MDRLSQITEDEFEHIEEEISRTVKGRAFLRRFRRQALGAATEEIRTMLEEFRLSWRQQTQAIEAANRISVLRQELIEMAASIERARREIAALQPADADNNKIISATSELDAIVISTERASFEILNAAERLMDLSSRFREGGADGELCSILDNEVTAIFTACSFQDLTGQRTSKVVNALRYIEQRVAAMIGIWGADEGDHQPITDDFTDKREDAHLLQGPQAEGKGVSQSDVDAMFSFDAPPASAALEAVNKLLAMAGSTAEAAPQPAAFEEDEEEDDPANHFSQADIDALMSGAPPPKPAGKPQSQTDIDALFGPDPPAPKPMAPRPLPAPVPAAKAKPNNQSDIDSMFDAPAPKAAAAPAPKPAPATPAPKGQPNNQAGIDSMFDTPAPKAAAAPAPKPATPAPKGQPNNQAGIDSMFDTPAPKAVAAPAPKPAPATPAPKGQPNNQAGIDSMFDAPAPKAAAAPAPKPAPATPAPKGKPNNQADIDSMFDTPAPKPAAAAKPKGAEPVTPLDQSAIDALFG